MNVAQMQEYVALRETVKQLQAQVAQLQKEIEQIKERPILSRKRDAV